MQAVILAAGRGVRLLGETGDRPKCLVEVGGKSLLEHQLQCLAAAGIERVFVVVGYEANQVCTVAGDRAAVIYNEHWATTNSLYSLWLTRRWISGPLLVLNCDVLAHPEIIDRVLLSGGDAFAYDSSSGDEDEHMKVHLESDTLLAMSKVLPVEESHGENVGLLYFSQDSAGLLFDEAEVALAENGASVWAAVAVERVARKARLRGIDVSDLPWIEIDFPGDLSEARKHVWPKIAAGSVGSSFGVVNESTNSPAVVKENFSIGKFG